MKYGKLGRSGLSVSALCLGMMSYGKPSWQPWVLDKGEGRAFVKQALDHGINFFDTADFYSFGASEESLGQAMEGMCRREELVISTKCGLPMDKTPNGRGYSRKHIRESLHASLERLGTDYVDVYMMHVWDGATPVEEMVDTLEDLVREGKVLYTGASNFMTWQIARAQQASRLRGGRGFTTMQLQYNLVYREEERDMLPWCEAEGLGVMVFSPLARGWLVNGDTAAGHLTERERVRTQQDAKAKFLYGSPADHAVRDRVLQIAEQRGVPPGRIGLAWLHAKPAVSTVLVGALEPRHLDEAVASLEVQLSAEEVAYLEGAYVAGPVKSDGLEQVLK